MKKTTPKISRRIGAMLGKAWQGWRRLENRLAMCFKKARIPVTTTKVVMRLLLVAGFAKLLYAIGVVSVFWAIFQIIVFMVLLVIILANLPSVLGESSSTQTYFYEDENDPRNQAGHDTCYYSDGDPDPRYED